jgi:uroporphyrinogen decarboxylase
MNSIQTIKEALSHREPDRVPLDIAGTRISGIHTKAYQRFRRKLGLELSNPRWQVLYLQHPKVEHDFYSKVGVDIESADPITESMETEVMSDNTGGQYYTDMYGNEWFMSSDAEYFDVRKPALSNVETVADVNRHKWPKGNEQAVVANLQEDARIIWHEHKRAVVLGRTSVGLFEMCAYLMGHEKALLNLALNPALIEAVMDKVLEIKLKYYESAINLLIAAGLDYFIFSDSEDLGTQKGLLYDPKVYRSIIKPRHLQLFSFIKKHSQGKAYIELHSCGAIRELIPDVIESGVEILNPIQVSATGMDDTKKLKKDFGDSLVFHGGGVDSQYTLPYGTPQEIKDEVRRRIEDLATDGGFIFTPVHSIQPDVPFENFTALLDAYREYC